MSAGKGDTPRPVVGSVYRERFDSIAWRSQFDERPLRRELDRMGVEITEDSVVVERGNGNQVYMRGRYAGHSISALARYYAHLTNRRYREFSYETGGGL